MENEETFEEILGAVEAETTNQSSAEVTSEPAPAPEAAPAATPTSGSDNSAFDLAKLNEKVRAFGNHEIKSVDDVVQVMGNLHKGMKDAQRERLKLMEESTLAQARLRRQQPFARPEEPQFSQPQQFMRQEEVPDAATYALQRVQALEERDAERELIGALDRLETDPTYKGFVTPEVRSEVMLKCAATGIYDPEAIFLKMYRNDIIAHVEQTTRAEALRAIQTNAAAGSGLMPTTVNAPSLSPVIDPATMTPEQKEQYINAESAKIASNPRYAAEVVRKHGGALTG